ncbi:hypothetical protein [Larkinella rosea]|uniref:Uma2 family endonuclease n=1 Tax=Larkinella rosea TaxID=2025312 RepID=A0A3P1BNZ7_9BACT|nr:hypothetical protein [Larkinella rosea]RRB02546.1 hypothetical protein EHT25_19015 [Larkinella rosea]
MAEVQEKQTTKRSPAQREARTARARLLETLVYEMWDGKPVYYAGYKDVLNGIKSAENVMSSSLLQGILIAKLVARLINALNEEEFTVVTNELGVQFKKNDWRACDIAVFSNPQLEGQDLSKYAWVPPKIAIEVDTKADFSRFHSDFNYYQEKTTQLLNFGIEKVIWIFTESKKIWIAEPQKDWILKNWDQPIDVLPGCSFVLDALLTGKKSA